MLLVYNEGKMIHRITFLQFLFFNIVVYFGFKSFIFWAFFLRGGIESILEDFVHIFLIIGDKTFVIWLLLYRSNIW